MLIMGKGFPSLKRWHPRLPLHRRLRATAMGKPIWRLRGHLFKHNKRRKPGKRRLTMRY
jgi:hypothetical protein